MICIALLPSMQIGVRQQRQKTRALDRRRQLALVVRLRAGNPRRHDLAVLLNEILQDVNVLVVDFLYLLGGKAAELAALEQIIAALAFLAVFSFSFASSNGTWH